MRSYDIAVVGSGFAGSLIAMIVRRLGHSVVLLEKGTHPRVVIGESSTPLSNLLLETLAARYDLPMLKPLTKWGTWQQTYPKIACGLKRGFTFFHHDLGVSTVGGHIADRQLLVAASPHDRIADTHWFRADFDCFFIEQARQLGVDSLEGCDIQQAERGTQGWVLTGRHRNSALTLRASFVIDATGPRGFLHRTLGLAEAPLPNYPATSALYSHFSGVAEFATSANLAVGELPYLPDAAALHHVFEGGWMWVLRFNNGWTSAGFAALNTVAEKMGFGDKQRGWNRMLEALPPVKRQFQNAKAERPFTYVPELSFRSAAIAGLGWAMLPSAAGFVDPLLSTGFPLTLLGVVRLAEIIERDWDTPQLQGRLENYAEETDAELLATARLIAALYANMGDFSMFRALALLYFAAASYAETVRRLGKAERALSFLLYNDEIFGPASRDIFERAQTPLSATEKLHLQEQIYALVERFDVAGLCRRPADHCYPVLAEDLFNGAGKIGASRAEIEQMLHQSGFYAANGSTQ